MIFWLTTWYSNTSVSKETATSILRVKDGVRRFIQKFDSQLRAKMRRLTYIFTLNLKYLVNNLSIFRHLKHKFLISNI
jgi:hypothetical protein